jgi:hypothetical protein
MTEDNVRDRKLDPDWPPDLGDFHRFEVPMTLQVSAASKDEALDRAMQWRDAIGMSGDPSAALAKLDFGWHLHHPNGC